MLSETHEKYQIIVARTTMYTVAKAFILHIRNLNIEILSAFKKL